MEDDPLFRRTRQHADKRLVFSGAKSDKQRLEDIKEFLRLEREMLLRYHRKGDSGLRLTRARAVIVDVLIQRKGENKLYKISLRNQNGNTELINRNANL